ncbi:MAG: hypothetical protein GY786_18995, partial [Proteobacteria bacterium]|nr:hypothetical protein [Pseudomonadota bacterium]
MFAKEKREAIRIRIHEIGEIALTFRQKGETFHCGIFDFSRFGFGIMLQRSQKLPIVGEKIEDIGISAYGDKRNLGNGVILNETKEGDHILIGLQLETEFLDIKQMLENHKIILQEDELRSINSYLSYPEKANDEFKLFCADFAFGLNVYKKNLDELDSKNLDEPEEIKAAFFKAIMTGVGRELNSFIDAKLEVMKKIV